MAATCRTIEAALQTGLLPAQERRKRCFAKASGRLKSFQTACEFGYRSKQCAFLVLRTSVGFENPTYGLRLVSLFF